jgi:hypothetical protein
VKLHRGCKKPEREQMKDAKKMAYSGIHMCPYDVESKNQRLRLIYFSPLSHFSLRDAFYSSVLDLTVIIGLHGLLSRINNSRFKLCIQFSQGKERMMM